MITWLYGLILPRNAERVPSGLAGIGDTPVRLLSCGPVTAVVGSVEQPARRSQVEAVRAHDRVLRAIAQQSVTVAAVRFGQSFASDDEACDELSARTADVHGLEQMDGRVEMRLLLPHHAVTIPEPSLEDAGPGRAYLESLRQHQPLPGVSLRAALGPLIQRERVERLTVEGGEAVVFAHLISAADVHRYRAAVTELPALAEARVLGPLPLYAFATDENG